MFGITDKLNEGKFETKVLKRRKTRLSEGKNPKVFTTDLKTRNNKPVRVQACVNANWQKLRG